MLLHLPSYLHTEMVQGHDYSAKAIFGRDTNESGNEKDNLGLSEVSKGLWS